MTRGKHRIRALTQANREADERSSWLMERLTDEKNVARSNAEDAKKWRSIQPELSELRRIASGQALPAQEQINELSNGIAKVRAQHKEVLTALRKPVGELVGALRDQLPLSPDALDALAELLGVTALELLHGGPRKFHFKKGFFVTPGLTSRNEKLINELLEYADLYRAADSEAERVEALEAMTEVCVRVAKLLASFDWSHCDPEPESPGPINPRHLTTHSQRTQHDNPTRS